MGTPHHFILAKKFLRGPIGRDGPTFRPAPPDFVERLQHGLDEMDALELEQTLIDWGGFETLYGSRPKRRRRTRP